MEQALAKIRIHTTSGLPHQKTPAALLVALESTFKEQKTDPSSTAYFAALLTTLDGTIQKKELSLNEGDVLPAELYLLALVVPFVSVPVIRTNLSTILALTAPLFPSLLNHAPALRSQLSLYHSVLVSLDRSQLETHGIRQAFASILQLCLDPRPKVRKKAAEVVRDVLSKQPPPLAIHPYAERVAEWTRSALADANKSAFTKSKGDSEGETATYILQFLRPVIYSLPSSSYSTLTGLLLHLPRLGNPYVSQSSYSILSDLFARSSEDGESSIDKDVLPEVLKSVMSFPPSKTDTTLAPPWLQVLGNAMVSYSLIDSEACAAQVNHVWKTVWPFLESSSDPVRKAAGQSLGLLSRCVVAVESSSKLVEIIAQVAKALTSVAYTRAIPELLSLTSALITNSYGTKGKRVSNDVVDQRLLTIITQIGNLRTEKGFECKEAADGVLSTAMRVLGPETLLEVLPLNLEPADLEAGLVPRGFLLPLISQPHPSPLSHFLSYFVPLSERLFDLQLKAESEGRERKIWQVIVAQIWAGFPAYCHGPPDIKETMNASFAGFMSHLLYTQPELRAPILKGLKVIVESNVALSNSTEDAINPSSISSEKASENVAILRTQVESWLGVLFNVFDSLSANARGQVGEVIATWLGIAAEQEVTKAYQNVVALLNANISKPPPPSGKPTNEKENKSVTALDLLLLLLPHLSLTDMHSLFQLCLSSTVLCAKDNAVQKRAYKILAKLVESGKLTSDAEAVLKELDTLSEGLISAAKKDRFNLLAALIPSIPSSAMHLIPPLIPEAVLGTKETSDKARTAAFELVIVMGRKMSQGGVVKRDLMEGMDEDEETAGEATANIDEYLTMVAGGLAGSTPHMISATITAISRLVFEFKDTLTSTMKNEIFTTLLVFLTSANREIVKSVLGYIKLAIHTYPVDLIQPHLKELVPALLTWSHDHKNHFKEKVRHIFERLLRRFSWDDVYSAAGEEEASKVLVNIKKRKERAKRKKANKEDEDDGAEAPGAKATAGDAFEDILYGSESELDESDDEEATGGRSQPRSKGKGQAQGMRLRVDDDEPMDLLQGVASRVTNASNRRRKPGQDASHFKTDEDSGKMVIADSDNEEDSPDHAMNDVSGTAYRESITSVDGFTRGPNGRVKFNKDTKKRRRDNEDLDAMDVDDNDKAQGRQKRRSSAKLGQEFRAKRAGGDVKKGGTDPYAYLTLAQAAKKGGRKDRIGVAGKR